MEVIAHRGASSYALENSREALELAWRMRADRVEIDVRASRDGKVLVLHDPLLNQTTTGQGAVAQFTWDELEGVRLRNGEPLLTLEEALDLLRGRIAVYIDIKDPRATDGVADLLNGLEDETLVGSTDPAVLTRVRQAVPRVGTSLLIREVDERAALSATAQGVRFVHACWEHHRDPLQHLTPTFLRRLQEAGLGVILWHEERERVLKHIAGIRQIYGVCTNTPDRACRILKPALQSEPGPFASGVQ